MVDAQALQNTVAGTPAYMAPEVFMGGQYGQSVDVYSLGAILFEMRTGGYHIHNRGERKGRKKYKKMILAHARRQKCRKYLQ